MFWRLFWKSQVDSVGRLATRRGRRAPSRSFLHEVALSMPFADGATPATLGRKVSDALGRRVVVIAGFSDLPSLGRVSERVFAARSVDCDRLLPRCCAAVHPWLEDHAGSIPAPEA